MQVTICTGIYIEIYVAAHVTGWLAISEVVTHYNYHNKIIDMYFTMATVFSWQYFWQDNMCYHGNNHVHIHMILYAWFNYANIVIISEHLIAGYIVIVQKYDQAYKY